MESLTLNRVRPLRVRPAVYVWEGGGDAAEVAYIYVHWSTFILSSTILPVGKMSVRLVGKKPNKWARGQVGALEAEGDR